MTAAPMPGTPPAPRGRIARTARTLVNFAAFEAAWFACVLGAAHARPGPGIVAVAAAVALQLAVGRDPARDLRLVAAALAIGIVWDTTLLRTGLVAYASPGPWPGVAPLWILALWALFATLLPASLRWLQPRPLTAALLGAAGGPLSYLGAARLGACTLTGPAAALVALGIGWAAITPALLALARRLDMRRGDAHA